MAQGVKHMLLPEPDELSQIPGAHSCPLTSVYMLYDTCTHTYIIHTNNNKNTEVILKSVSSILCLVLHVDVGRGSCLTFPPFGVGEH